MACVYLLRGQTGRHYIGSTTNLDQRIERHNSGMVYSTKRLGLPMELIAFREFSDQTEARRIEAKLKRWKNPTKARAFLELR